MPLNNAHFRGFFFYNMTQIILYYTIYHAHFIVEYIKPMYICV